MSYSCYEYCLVLCLPFIEDPGLYAVCFAGCLLTCGDP